MALRFTEELRHWTRKSKHAFSQPELQSEQYSDDTFSSLPPPNYFIRIPIENERLLERIEEIMAEAR